MGWSNSLCSATSISALRRSWSGRQAVVLACEDGRRLYPLTQDCPAPLLPVLNKPLLHYQLELLEKAGFTGADPQENFLCRREQTASMHANDIFLRLYLPPFFSAAMCECSPVHPCTRYLKLPYSISLAPRLAHSKMNRLWPHHRQPPSTLNASLSCLLLLAPRPQPT